MSRTNTSGRGPDFNPSSSSGTEPKVLTISSGPCCGKTSANNVLSSLSSSTSQTVLLRELFLPGSWAGAVSTLLCIAHPKHGPCQFVLPPVIRGKSRRRCRNNQIRLPNFSHPDQEDSW